MQDSKKNRVAVWYDHFEPAYKAGGPIRSLVNLVKYLEKNVEFYILTGDTDHDGTKLNVARNSWTPYGANSKVVYLDDLHKKKSFISTLIRNLDIDVFYINGIFSYFTTVIPLQLSKKYTKTIIIAPRGMLQLTSLSLKAFKKKAYLFILEKLWLSNRVKWHLTTEQERDDFAYVFNKYSHQVELIGNVPHYTDHLTADKKYPDDEYIFGTLALISPMKNIDLILKALLNIRHNVKYIIYGPIKDKTYWRDCQLIIDQMPANIVVEYRGPIYPQMTGEAIRSFDFYIQPSRSENFGHSIFEAFNQGIPVIISDQTPWRNLNHKNAGWDVNIDNPQNLLKAVNEAIGMTEEVYLAYSIGARKVAEQYMNVSNLREKYLALFSN